MRSWAEPWLELQNSDLFLWHFSVGLVSSNTTFCHLDHPFSDMLLWEPREPVSPTHGLHILYLWDMENLDWIFLKRFGNARVLPSVNESGWRGREHSKHSILSLEIHEQVNRNAAVQTNPYGKPNWTLFDSVCSNSCLSLPGWALIDSWAFFLVILMDEGNGLRLGQIHKAETGMSSTRVEDSSNADLLGPSASAVKNAIQSSSCRVRTGLGRVTECWEWYLWLLIGHLGYDRHFCMWIGGVNSFEIPTYPVREGGTRGLLDVNVNFVHDRNVSSHSRAQPIPSLGPMLSYTSVCS